MKGRAWKSVTTGRPRNAACEVGEWRKAIIQNINHIILMETSKARIPYLDFLKFFAIGSVLLGHSVEQLTGNDYWDNPIWSFIYTYHMPLFMLLCGYFFGSSLKLTFGELLKKKFVQLLLPSVTAFVIVWTAVSVMGHNPWPALFTPDWMGFMNTVWFLKCVFLCYLVGFLSIRLFRNVWLAALVTVVLSGILPYGGVANFNFMLPMFWVGYACKLNQSLLDRHRKWFLGISLVAFGVMLPFWSGRLTVYMVPTQVLDWGTFTWDVQNLSVVLYRLAIGIAGSMSFFLLSPYVYRLIEGKGIATALNGIGRSTLGIYWLQTFLLEYLFNSLGFYVPMIWTFVLPPCLALVELVVCYRLVLLFKKNVYIRLFVLGER